ncbi:hypothetical protein IB223_14685 [Pseudoxanthomonas sp. PXM03]|uniref:DUF6988 family protein n=1 Tax=Pseudoxanthomonas sp. PXM03 TaxID=2769284 RepID=UPI00177EAA56|nr:hypothetical protein [Pseudoxanthomonas sp. PXM03]MBD9437347.1 hypothetical protein [Pseudoxanthomonas sp. PXM03]
MEEEQPDIWEEFVLQSHELVVELIDCVAFDVNTDEPRIALSEVLLSLAFEHSHSARMLLHTGFLPSALVVHRSQFEAVVRSLWVLYGASDQVVGKLSAELNLVTELAAKNIPTASKMMEDLAVKAPPNAFKPLNHFKTHMWGALNSYVHAGIHPIRRHADGYPAWLLTNVMKNVNGLSVVTAMQAAMLLIGTELQQEVLTIADRYAHVLGPPN